MKNENEEILNEESELKAIREFTGDDSVTFLKPDDTFNFKCNRCGKCCMNRNDIVLNPFDVYNASKYLGVTCDEFIDKHCYVILGANSRLPIVLLKSQDNGYCSFLEKDDVTGLFGCTINPVKPGACSNHPIGVISSLNKETKENLGIKFIKVQQCSNSSKDEVQVVRDWVKPYTDNIKDIEIAHSLQSCSSKYFEMRMFYGLLTFSSLIAKKEETREKVSEMFDDIANSFISLQYVNYDINLPFGEQALRNKEKLERQCEEIKETYGQLKATLEEEFDKVTDKLIGPIGTFDTKPDISLEEFIDKFLLN